MRRLEHRPFGSRFQLPGQRLFPGLQPFGKLGIVGFQGFLGGGDGLVELLQPCGLVRCGNLQRGFILIIEEREQLVILALADGIELVLMALGTTDGEAHPHGPRGVGAIPDRFDPKLLRVGPAFLVDERVPMKTRGDELLRGGVRQQIAGELLVRKLIERQIAVEGIDHPIAVFPDAPRAVDREPVGVRIAGEIQPMPAPAFAILRRSQHPLHQPLVSIRPAVIGRRPRFPPKWAAIREDRNSIGE